jgi:hypothetical protein
MSSGILFKVQKIAIANLPSIWGVISGQAALTDSIAVAGQGTAKNYSEFKDGFSTILLHRSNVASRPIAPVQKTFYRAVNGQARVWHPLRLSLSTMRPACANR